MLALPVIQASESVVSLASKAFLADRAGKALQAEL
jgi:hypothetical protein